MVRTTISKVRNVFDTDLTDNELSSWIDVATELVDDVENADPSIPDKRLEKIERLTTAHLASAQDPRIESASREGSNVSYQGETGKGFESTSYGQRALELDPTGTLEDDTEFTLSV